MTTTEFLAVLLNQVEELCDNTEDWASIHALHIAIAAIEADENEKMSETSAEIILEEMSALASWIGSGRSDFSPAIRVRLAAIRDTHPDFGGPEVAS